MVKKTKELEKEVETSSGNEVAKVKTFAIIPDGAGFKVLNVLFDPNTSEVHRRCATRDEAVEAFKIALANTGMLG